MITREKCLELARAAGFSVCRDEYLFSEMIESLVRASVALGLELAAKECDYDPRRYGRTQIECAREIRKLAEEVQRGE